ncbi:response regulator [Nitrospira sp. Kam-Ns4a]
MSATFRILHLEDSAADAALVQALLEQEGLAFEILRVDSREAFVQALQEGEFDLILSDNTLPAFDGLAALALAQERRPDVPFIFVSGTLGEEVAVESLKRGAADYILKERPARLVAAITRTVEESKARAERRRIEEALREAQERLRGIYESSRDAIGYTALDGRLVDVNSAFVRLTGWSREELLGIPCLQLAAPDHRGVTADTWARVLRTGDPAEYDMDLLRQDGSRVPVSLTVFAVMDQGDRPVGVAMIIKDMTERKQLEVQLRHAQKMEAIGQLAGGIAHDFNNLLTVINGYSELLLTILPADPAWRNPVEEIKKAGTRAAALTRQLLAFSRKQLLEPRVLDLNAVIAQMGQMLRRLVREDIEIVTRLDPALGRVKADPGQIEQVLMNLVVNARDAMPQGGQLTITTGNAEPDSLPAASRATAPPGPYVTLAVRDTGCGMDEATLARIFEPFFTTKEPSQGTGLGLSTVHGIVKQHGGTIAVESRPGQGTTFTLYLPRVAEEPAQGPDPHISGSVAPRGSETILLVEDEAMVRDLVTTILRHGGYTVLAARDGAEALRLCREHRGPLHLLISDVVLPGMSAQDVSRQAAALRPELKVLYLSGYQDDAAVRPEVAATGLAFLRKPFTQEELARKVRAVLDA